MTDHIDTAAERLEEYQQHRADCPFTSAPMDVCDCTERNLLDALGAKDVEIARLTADLHRANSNHEYYERAYYLETDRTEKAEAMLDHTQQWYAERVRKIEDVAKREGLWPEIAAILANGSATRQMPDGSFLYDPPTYAQQLNIAKHRAEKAEAERNQALAQIAAAYEVAALVTVDMGPRYDGRPVHYHIPENVKKAIRALAPADAEAAMQRVVDDKAGKLREAGENLRQLVSLLANDDVANTAIAEWDALKRQEASHE